MEWWQIALIIGIAVLVISILLIIILAKLFKNKNKEVVSNNSNLKVEPVTIINGVRYTNSDTALNSDGSVKATLSPMDFILERGKEFVVSKFYLLPGKYTLLSSDENTLTFNIRVGGFVREYKHMSSIILAEGDKVCAVSHTVILR